MHEAGVRRASRCGIWDPGHQRAALGSRLSPFSFLLATLTLMPSSYMNPSKKFHISLESHVNARDKAVASRDISPGEVIITEHAWGTALVPGEKGKRCDHCHRVRHGGRPLRRCTGCASYWYCGTACMICANCSADLPHVRHRPECRLEDIA